MPAARQTPGDQSRGRALRNLRKYMGLSTEEMAAAMDISQSGYEHWESGRRRIDGQAEHALADFLGLAFDTVRAVLGGAIEPQSLGMATVSSRATRVSIPMLSEVEWRVAVLSELRAIRQAVESRLA